MRCGVGRDGLSKRAVAGVRPGVQCAMRAEIAACGWAAEATAGAVVVVSDCDAVHGRVAALRRGDRGTLDGEDGDLSARTAAALLEGFGGSQRASSAAMRRHLG